MSTKRTMPAEANEARKRNRPGEDRVTEREKLFALHYIGAAKHSATEAIVLAGINTTSRRQAARLGSLYMTRPRVRAEVDRLIEERNEALVVTAHDVLRDLVILRTDAEMLSRKSAPALRTRLDVIKTIGDHVNVGAFRRQVGLSSPSGGPIETADAAWLAEATDEEPDALERARAIIERRSGSPAKVPDDGGDSSGEGTTPAGD